MKQGGGRLKGFAFERVIAERIGEWWCDDRKAFWRNTNSGARATVVKGVYSGDIIPVSDKAKPWPFSIEVKKAENWSIDGFIYGNEREPLLLYMIQCLNAAQHGTNKLPLLICGKNRKSPLAFLHVPSFNFSRSSLWKLDTNIARIKRELSLPLLDMKFDFYVMDLEVFFHTFTREDF